MKHVQMSEDPHYLGEPMDLRGEGGGAVTSGRNT